MEFPKEPYILAQIRCHFMARDGYLMKFGHGTYPSIDVAGNEIMTGLSPACFREAAP
jgi:hypothetical protein